MERAIQYELAKRFLVTARDVTFDGRKWHITIRYQFYSKPVEITHTVYDEIILRIRRELSDVLH